MIPTLGRMRPSRVAMHRLGVRMGATADEGYALISLVSAVLNEYCQASGPTDAKCAEFTARLNICLAQLNTGVATGDIVAIGAAVLCLKNLHDDVTKAREAQKNPPVIVTTTTTPSSGFPWGTVAALAGGATALGLVIYLVTRKKG